MNPTQLETQGLYLTGEDNLRITSFGAIAGAEIALEGRLVDPDRGVQAFAERHVPNSDRTAKTTVHNVGSGLLTNAQLRATAGSVLGGGVFAILEIIRGFSGGVQPLGTLLQGYVTSNARLAWPGSPILPSTAGAGRLRSITGTDPAAGVEILETVPANVRWRLYGIRFVFVTSAVAANRSVVLVFDDGTNQYLSISDNQVQAASLSHTYVAMPSGQIGLMGGSLHTLNLPNDLWLPAGSRFGTATGSKDAGDNFSAPQYLVEEFIE